ncbi:DsbA family protein [Pseudogracilibacillus auburnensis]|uniref:DsbA family protein n=1 Tax=Pseudogracilibacillus auburnensis TaxID=1494959 RepID=UPI001A971BA4|nr:DsbA family protein [Pseudogracilibacillus auburnensis]MBO1002021.1 DsbA family protein [Pseudogracilibacillus auburnensis]
MNNNHMICDLETGVCGPSGESEVEMIDLNTVTEKKLTLYYVTDPICSHCWALEPVLRRFEKQYSHYFHMQTVMGGLLEKWEGFADVKNGISGPADVAGHWREVGEHSRMPIDGSVWLQNPIFSSYPPSRVYKVIQQENDELAHVFLRRVREAVFAFNRNIAEDEVLIEIVNNIGLDGEKIVKQANEESSQELLNQDFSLARSLGATGFPTIIIVNEENKGVKIVGARPFEFYLQGLQQVLEMDELHAKQKPSLSQLMEEEGRLFTREIEEFYQIEQQEVSAFIQKELLTEQYVEKKILGEVYIEKK